MLIMRLLAFALLIAAIPFVVRLSRGNVSKRLFVSVLALVITGNLMFQVVMPVVSILSLRSFDIKSPIRQIEIEEEYDPHAWDLHLFQGETMAVSISCFSGHFSYSIVSLDYPEDDDYYDSPYTIIYADDTYLLFALTSRDFAEERAIILKETTNLYEKRDDIRIKDNQNSNFENYAIEQNGEMTRFFYTVISAVDETYEIEINGEVHSFYLWEGWRT